MDCGGDLKYDTAKKSFRVLGSKFFQDLQTGNKANNKQKVYDVNYTEEPEAIYYQEEDDGDEEAIFQTMLESGDEDASFVHEFEEQILVACQESADLAACFTSYQEARQRLRDKAKSRGFWPVTGGKGRGGKGKKGKSGKHGGGYGRRRSLAERIANSVCKKCLQPGHWKRECPNAAVNPMTKKGGEPEAFTGVMDHADQDTCFEVEKDDAKEPDIVMDLPPNATVFTCEDAKDISWSCTGFSKMFQSGTPILKSIEQSTSHKNEEEYFTGLCLTDLTTHLGNRLQQCCRKYDVNCPVSAASHSDRTEPASAELLAEPAAAADIFNAEEAFDEAIIDTGASRAVIGHARLHRMISSFPRELTSRVMKVPSEVVFKFGNAGRLTSTYAIMLPRAKNGWLRVEVVPGHTPFLISNAVLKELRGVIDVESQELGFKNSSVRISLFPVRKNLLGIKICDLLKYAPHKNDVPDHVLCAPVETIHTHTTVEIANNENSELSTFPKESVSDQGLIMTFQTSSCATPAAIPDRGVITGGRTCTTRESRRNGHEQGLLHGSSVDHSDGCQSSDHQFPWRSTPGDDASTRHQFPDRLGSPDITVRKTCGQDLCGHLRGGQRVCEPDVEQTRGLILGEELPALLQTTSSIKPGTSSTACATDRDQGLPVHGSDQSRCSLHHMDRDQFFEGGNCVTKAQSISRAAHRLQVRNGFTFPSRHQWRPMRRPASVDINPHASRWTCSPT